MKQNFSSVLMCFGVFFVIWVLCIQRTNITIYCLVVERTFYFKQQIPFIIKFTLNLQVVSAGFIICIFA